MGSFGVVIARTSVDDTGLRRRSRTRFRVLVAVAIVAAMGGALAFIALPLGGGEVASSGEPAGTIAYTVAVVGGERSFVPTSLALDGGSPSPLLGDAAALSPKWSPDGSSLAFLTVGDGGFGLAVNSGGSVTQLLNGSDVRDLSWSPDGTKLAVVVHGREEGQDRIQLVDVSTGESTPVIDGGSWSGVDWSPVDDSLVLAGAPTLGSDNVIDTGIYLVGLTGGEPRVLTDEARTYDFVPRWSPDGAAIVFTRSPRYDDVSPRMDVFAVDPSSGAVRPVIQQQGFDGFPAWSPDGSWILFASDRSESRETPMGSAIDAIHPDGTDEHELVPQVDNEFRIPSDWR
jgi:Tol biopolymer transport system component